MAPAARVSSMQVMHLTSAYASRTLSPLDVVDQVYGAIAACSDKAIWIHLIPHEDAIIRARELLATYPDSTLRPPLFGIPFSVKDSIDVAGLPTTLACPSFAYIAQATAPVVERILQAGAILIGKTNLDQFATGLTGARSPYGAPRCALDADYISGGSSSGSAVSVATALVSFSICTDTGGSTRVPAALNGVIGLKPTLGTISTTGLFPACKNIDCVCIMAQTVNDAHNVWNVAKAFDETDPFARRSLPLWPPYNHPVRFSIPNTEALSALSPTYAKLFDDTVSTLRNSSIFAETEVDYSLFEKANQMLYDSSIVTQRLLAFEDYTKSHGLDLLHPDIKKTFESAESNKFDAIKAYQDIFSLAQYRRDAEVAFEGTDVLIVPATVCHWTMSEFLEDTMGRNKVMGKFTNFVNLLDLCGISVPVQSWRSVNGKVMSFGVTVIGQAGKDEEVMDVSKRLMSLHWDIHS